MDRRSDQQIFADTAARSEDWMWQLAAHYEQMRRAYPVDELCIVFDIDGTILDMRYIVTRALVSYDRAHGTEFFVGLNAEDVDVHENRLDDFLRSLRLPSAVRGEIAAWVERYVWTPECVFAGSRPFRGVLGVIRWFQLQPRTSVALNTGRPQSIRDLTLRSLNSLGRAYRVRFDPDLLSMNSGDWEEDVPGAKVSGLRRLQARGLRIVAVVDNEPANLRAIAEADESSEILLLHADTIFESQRDTLPRAVAGSRYDLAGLVRETELRDRVEFVWHGVNDEANLRQFLASEVRWAECDVRRDPLDRLVLRHDSFIETPWTRSEHPFLLGSLLERLREEGRAVVLDIKENDVVDEVIVAVEESAIRDGDVGFSGSIGDLHRSGITRLSRRFPTSPLCVPADFLAPLVEASSELAWHVLEDLRRWGVNRLGLEWSDPEIRDLIDHVESAGWDVNIYAIADLESFLEAALLLPRAVTADFNFPDRHYYGRGSGQRRAYHRYHLAPGLPA